MSCCFLYNIHVLTCSINQLGSKSLSHIRMRRLKVADRVGQQFGNYRLVALLGTGGYAEVYLGQHLRLNQQAAIKVLHAHLTGSEAEHFQQEAQTIATLVHPAIIRVFDYDVQDGVPFLVMDYAPHGSLRQRYPKGSLVPLPLSPRHFFQVRERTPRMEKRQPALVR
jgi:serine/threonine protein kinase